MVVIKQNNTTKLGKDQMIYPQHQHFSDMKNLLMLLLKIWTCHNMSVLVLVSFNFKTSRHLTFLTKICCELLNKVYNGLLQQ